MVFPFLFLLYYVIPAKRQPVRNLYLLAVSYLLYMNFKPVYAIILLGVTAITFFAARFIEYRKDVRLKSKGVLTFGVLLTLLPLLVFKYYNFINESCFSLLSSFGLRFELPGLQYSAHTMTRQQANKLLRKDLCKFCAMFRQFGKDSLLLDTLAYNVGPYRLLGNKKIPKSTLVKKLEAGNRNIYKEYIPFRCYKGKVVPSIEWRKKGGISAAF